MSRGCLLLRLLAVISNPGPRSIKDVPVCAPEHRNMRQSSRSQEIRVGIITIAAVVALVGAIVWGKGIGFGVERRPIHMRFADATGLEVGSPVTLNGVRQGVVTALHTNPDFVIVDASVDTRVPLHSDATARLEMGELTGGKRIALLPGHADELLARDDVIQGTVGVDPATLLADVGRIGGDARTAILRLDTSLAAVNAIVTDRTFRARIDNTLINLESASGSARSLVVDNRVLFDRTLRNVDQAAAELRALVLRTSPAVDRTVGGADDAIADVRRAVVVADLALRSADTLLRRLDTIAVDLRQGGGTASMLLYDTTFAHELRQTVNATRKLVEETRKKGFNLNIGFGRRE